MTSTFLTNGEVATASGFAGFMARCRANRRLVVQPRMGFSDASRMRRGLIAVKAARACTAGTITLDSYTRVGDHQSALRSVRAGRELNGYPLVVHGARVTGQMLEGVHARDFPVQVRHGSALPQEIFSVLVEAGLDATEGGPVSYCLPYSRTPLRQAVDAWAESCEILARLSERGVVAHLESFGGCMLGQLCPPSLLVAISVLEGVFFRRHGLASISLSYAQQTNPEQDAEAIQALRRLADELLGDIDWHVVLYTFMGVFPRSEEGALALLQTSARLAVRAGADRLIVKTPAEAHRIPSIQENVRALEWAEATAADERRRLASGPWRRADTGVYAAARALVECVLALDDDIGRGLVRAFRQGYLDVPYCLHPDNANRSRSYVDRLGRVRWASVGAMPIPADREATAPGRVTWRELLAMLSYNQVRFDPPVLSRRAARRLSAP
jgi:methylaspartate mutase epsilon subunit